MGDSELIDSKMIPRVPWGIEWYTIDTGYWRIYESEVFRLTAYWFNIDDAGVLVHKVTGEALIVDKNFYNMGRWKIE